MADRVLGEQGKGDAVVIRLKDLSELTGKEYADLFPELSRDTFTEEAWEKLSGGEE